MFARRCVWLMGMVVAATLVGCVDGGRGSSGFDITENAAIRLVLETQECYEGAELTLCPADRSPSAAPASPTPTAVPPPPTATPDQSQRVDTGLANGASIVCARTSPDGPCVVAFSFGAVGFPATATFAVASRLQTPATAWRLAPPPQSEVIGGTLTLSTTVTIDVPADAVEPRVQFAVLVFFADPGDIPQEFNELADTGATFAYVTSELVLETVTVEPSPPPTPGTPTPIPSMPTATATPTEVTFGPQITHFGLARADNLALAPTSFDPEGRPIYVRPFGSGSILIFEARPGVSGRPVGRSAYDATGALPDLQVILSRPIGDGSQAVCDTMPPDAGGVPAVMPFAFDGGRATVDAINDLGCRVDNGAGLSEGRTADNACTRNRNGDFAFVSGDTTLQFCLPIAAAWAFPAGDTIVAARARDSGGMVGDARELVVRVARGGAPTSTPTLEGSPLPTPTPPASGPSPSPTATGSVDQGPRVTYFGLAKADSSLMQPVGTDSFGRPIYRSSVGQGMSLIVEAQPGSGRRPPGRSAFADNGLPDFQMILSRPLGDGSPQVCDVRAPLIGGVPATMPFAFSDDSAVTAAINDLGCRVNDGTGQPLARVTSMDACTSSNLGGPSGFAYVNAASTVQFCLPIAGAWHFQLGDTAVAVRLRDQSGALGSVREILVRIEPGAHNVCDDDEREFFVARPDSLFRSSGTTLADVSTDPWINDRMVLCIGPDSAGGRHPLRLRDDVTFGIPLVDGSVLCALLDAEQSQGEIDCNGDSVYDVTVTRNSRGAGPADALYVSTGGRVGDNRPGAAVLHTFFQVALLPPGSSPDTCHRSYRFLDHVTLSTEHTTVAVTNPIQGGPVAIEAQGRPFDCAHLLEPGSGGALVFPFVGLDTVEGDTANVLILAE